LARGVSLRLLAQGAILTIDWMKRPRARLLPLK
jgi:hypothetical protein